MGVVGVLGAAKSTSSRKNAYENNVAAASKTKKFQYAASATNAISY
jgi:hypothetical protein